MSKKKIPWQINDLLPGWMGTIICVIPLFTYLFLSGVLGFSAIISIIIAIIVLIVVLYLDYKFYFSGKDFRKKKKVKK